MTYTAEAVREEAETVGMVAECRKDREPGWTRTASMLTAYADLLDRQAVAVTDVQIMAEWFKADGSVHGPNVETVTMPRAKYLALRRSLLAIHPVAAEPVAQGGSEFDVRKYVQHLAEVLESGLFSVDADLSRLGTAINDATHATQTPAVPEAWRTALKDAMSHANNPAIGHDEGMLLLELNERVECLLAAPSQEPQS